MELKIDLIPKAKKSKFALSMGITGILLAILYLVVILHKKQDDWMFAVPMMLYMLVLGTRGIVIGLGYSFEKYFGSAYIHIDDQHIAIKPGIRTKEQSISWNRIKSMEYKTNWFHIAQTDGSSSKFSLSDLEFKVLIEARDAIRLLASEKGITIN
ncbi:MAG: hypothetical protein WCP08_15395 [Prolixibacteraceae bacterium]